MNPHESNLAEAKAALAEMASEANELKLAAGGPITDVVADWLAAKCVMAARDKLNGHSSGPSWELLRAMVQDWTALRRGDHSAARLQLDREELDLPRVPTSPRKREKGIPRMARASGYSRRNIFLTRRKRKGLALPKPCMRLRKR